MTFWNEAIGYTTGGMLNLDWSTAGVAQYGYDQATRLTSTTVGGVLARSYAFDANTNRCANAASCVAPTFTYDQADRLTASPYGSAYVYDTHGNLTSYTKAGGGTVSFQYDAYDHATRIDDGTTRTDEVLAPSGRVLKRTVTSPPGGTVTENTIKGYTGDGDSPNWSQPVAGGSYTNYLGTAIVTGTTAVYQVSNWHGDIVGTVTQAGVFTAQAYPDEYGNVTTVPSSRLGWLGSQQRFVTAPALGIIRMGVRLYDPKLGRFLAQDTIEGGSCNDYDYTCANPSTASTWMEHKYDRAGTWYGSTKGIRCIFS